MTSSRAIPDGANEGEAPKGSASAEIADATSHSFIVRIWREDGAAPGDAWLGTVTHVPSGRRRLIRSLREIETFVRPYTHLLEMDDGRPGLLACWRRLCAGRHGAGG